MFEDVNLKTAQEIKEDTGDSIVQSKKDELIRIKNENEESDPYSNIRVAALKHSKSTSDHITQALEHENNKTDPYGSVRRAAINNSKVNIGHINHVLNHENDESDPDGSIREGALKARNNKVTNITKSDK